MRSRWKLVAGGAVVVAVLTWLVGGGIGDNLVYFLTPRELLARGERAYGSSVRLEGRVESGSVKWNADSLRLRFRITQDGVAIPVESEGAPPQMFQDGIHVVVEGTLDRAGLFRAHELMVKHSNEYQPPREGDPPPEVRYHQLLTSGGDAP